MIKKFITILLVAFSGCGLLYALSYVRHYFISGLNPFLCAVFLLFMGLLLFPPAFWALRKIKPWTAGVTATVLFLTGGVTWLLAGLFYDLYLGNPAMDFQLRNTFDVISRVHYGYDIGILLLVVGGVYAGYRQLTKRPLNRAMGYVHFWLTFLAIYLLWWPGISSYEGLAGMPRRYLDYSGWVSIPVYSFVNTWEFAVLVLAQLVFVFNIAYSGLARKQAS